MNRFSLGLVAESLAMPVRAVIEQASALGVQGLQFQAIGDLAAQQLGTSARRDFRNLLKSYNLELSAIACPLRRGLDCAEDLQPRIEYVQKTLQLAYDLGPRRVIVPCPPIPPEAESSRAATLKEALQALGTFCDKVGSELCLEVGFDSGDTVMAFLNTLDVGGVAVNFDPANFLLNGHDPLKNLTVLGPRIRHVHARDARAADVSGSPQEVSLGAGDIDWMLLVATLEALEYRGYLTIERSNVPHPLSEIRHAVQFLRRFTT